MSVRLECPHCRITRTRKDGFCPVCCPAHEKQLREVRTALALQVFRYANKNGVPDAVRFALRDTLAPDGHSPLPSQRPIVDALEPFLRIDGGDYGLRRAFDAFVALLDKVNPLAVPNGAEKSPKEST